MSERKIKKLTKMIMQTEKEIEKLDKKINILRTYEEEGKITKAEFKKRRSLYQEQIRGLRGKIVRLEKARLNIERKMKEKKKEKEEEERKKRERELERKRELEKLKRKKRRMKEKKKKEKDKEEKVKKIKKKK